MNDAILACEFIYSHYSLVFMMMAVVLSARMCGMLMRSVRRRRRDQEGA